MLTCFPSGRPADKVTEGMIRLPEEPIRTYSGPYSGTREQKFYNELDLRMGFEEAADRVQQLYMELEYEDAA